jgi:hypothetical protein
MSDDLLNMLAECETPEDLAALEALAAEIPVQPEPRILRTLGEVAAFLGVQPQTVRAWRMESPPMPGEPGRYDLDAIEAWKAQRALRNELPGMAELNVASQRAELARRLESVRGKQLRNEILTERVVSLREVNRDALTGLSIVDSRLKRLPTEVAANVPEELAEVIRNEVQQTITVTLQMLNNDLGHLLPT